MKLGVIGRLVARVDCANETTDRSNNQYTDECPEIGEYLCRTSLPRLTVDFERDARIVSEGEPALEAFVVIEGTARLCRDEFFGGRRILGHAKPGDLVLPLTSDSHQFSLESATAVTLMVFSLDLIERFSAIDMRLRRQMGIHRAAHRSFASGSLYRTVDAFRRAAVLAPRRTAVDAMLKSYGAYAAGL